MKNAIGSVEILFGDKTRLLSIQLKNKRMATVRKLRIVAKKFRYYFLLVFSVQDISL